MSTTNELIAQIESAKSRGLGVKSIRRQKYDPNNFYMTLTDGKSVGPVKVEGNAQQLDQKFNDAQARLATSKNAPRKAA